MGPFMHLLTKEQCKIGMEVYLIDPKSYYIPTTTNPTKGSKFECTGTITSVNSMHSYFIEVAWENGTNNCYKDKELLAIGSRYHSIW